MPSDQNKLTLNVQEKFAALIDDTEVMAEVLCAEFSRLVQNKELIDALIVAKVVGLQSNQLDRQDLTSRDVILAKGDRFAIAVRVVQQSAPGPLCTSQDLMFIAALNETPLRYRKFHFDRNVDIDAYDPDARLIDCGLEELSARSVLALCNHLELFELEITKPTQLIRLVVTPSLASLTTQIWTFSRDSLRPVGTSARHFRDTSLALTAAVLGQLDQQRSIPSLMFAAEKNRAHFVRWAAIKAIAAIDADQALIAANRALNDEHPHVRAAAKSVIFQLAP